MAITGVKPPLAGWVGGKSLLAKEIIGRFPEHQCYVEVFAGAGWVFFRKPESEVEVLNDLNREVATLYRVVRYHLDELVRHFRWALVSRDEFERQLATPSDTLTDIQRAARFFYLLKMSFGGRVSRPTMGYAPSNPPRLNLLRIEEDLSEAHLRLARTYIECLPYQDVIRRYDRPETLFYVDPPYWGCEDYYGEGMFAREDFARLADQLGGIKGRFLLSLNDTPEVREIFAGFHLEEVRTRYTISKGTNRSVGELLIRNYRQ